MLKAEVIVITILITLVSLPPKSCQHLEAPGSSPCPQVFSYEVGTSAVPGARSALLHISTDETLYGIWIHIIFDRSVSLISSFGTVTTLDSRDYQLEDSGHILLSSSALKIPIFLRHVSGDIIPKLKNIRVNGKEVCFTSDKASKSIAGKRSTSVNGDPYWNLNGGTSTSRTENDTDGHNNRRKPNSRGHFEVQSSYDKGSRGGLTYGEEDNNRRQQNSRDRTDARSSNDKGSIGSFTYGDEDNNHRQPNSRDRTDARSSNDKGSIGGLTYGDEDNNRRQQNSRDRTDARSFNDKGSIGGLSYGDEDNNRRQQNSRDLTDARSSNDKGSIGGFTYGDEDNNRRQQNSRDRTDARSSNDKGSIGGFTYGDEDNNRRQQNSRDRTDARSFNDKGSIGGLTYGDEDNNRRQQNSRDRTDTRSSNDKGSIGSFTYGDEDNIHRQQNSRDRTDARSSNDKGSIGGFTYGDEDNNRRQQNSRDRTDERSSNDKGSIGGFTYGDEDNIHRQQNSRDRTDARSSNEKGSKGGFTYGDEDNNRRPHNSTYSDSHNTEKEHRRESLVANRNLSERRDVESIPKVRIGSEDFQSEMWDATTSPKSLSGVTPLSQKIDSGGGRSSISTQTDLRGSQEDRHKDGTANDFNGNTGKNGYNRVSSEDYFEGDHNIPKAEKIQPTPLTHVANYHRPTDESLRCGQVAPRATPLIVSGESTRPGQWPWHVALYQSQTVDSKYICGGSLVTLGQVLTAAHCVTRKSTESTVNPQTLVLHLGKHNLRKASDGTQIKLVRRISIHPEYNSTSFYADIALLRMTNQAEFTNWVRPVCLWRESERDLSYVVEQEGSVVGWGFDESENLQEELAVTKMPVVKHTTCLWSFKEFFSHFTSNHSFCAGFANGTSVCNGDSGGGMVFSSRGSSRESSPRWRLRGVVSISVARQNDSTCDPNHYVVFTDVAQYLDWIYQIIGV